MGDNNAVIVQILAVVAILFFCFVTFMNTKTWRWLHVTAMFLVFAAALTFVVYAAMVMKMRQAWQKTVANLEARVEQDEKKYSQALNGDLTSQEDRALGLLDLRAAIGRAIIDRGRVWRQCSLLETQIVSPGAPVSEVKVKLSTVPRNALEGQKIKPNGMTEKTILYAFKRISDENQPLRYIYLGEFYADSVSNDSVSLTSTLPLSGVEQGLLEGNQDWVLHEGMPRDAHNAYTDAGEVADWKTVLHADEFPSPEVYEAVVGEYARHGSPVQDDDLQKAENLEKIYAQVKFKQPYKYVVDAPDVQSPAADNSESRLFNADGLALSPLLRRGGEVEFKQGDTATLIYFGLRDDAGNIREPGAKELEEQGVVEIAQKVYFRKLNDYSYQFREIYMNRVKIQQLSRALDYEVEQVDKEFAISTANLQILNDRIAKLEADAQKLADEKAKITQYAARVKAALDQTRAEFTQVLKEIDRRHAELVDAGKSAVASTAPRAAAETR
jgi:hypothetical protein